MKKTSSDILTLLSNKNILRQLNDLKVSYPTQQYSEMNIDEAIEKYEFICNTLKEEIQSGRLDKLPLSRRNVIYGQLTYIRESMRDFNYVLGHIDQLYDGILSSGILANRIGKTDLITERKELHNSKKKYENIVADIIGAQNDLSFISSSRENLEKVIDEASQTRSKILKILDNSETLNAELVENKSGLDERLLSIKDVEEEIEEKRLSITTFSNNIEEYKDTIAKLEDRLKILLKREDEVAALIQSAHEALKLGSTVGVSSAFALQYEQADKPSKKNWWVVGALTFLLLAAGLTIWVVSDVENSDKIGVVIGRIAAVAITLAGAAFCSRQYIKQKNIAEDYAYKAVLSKSIIAFTEEIADSHDNGEKHVGAYLEKVLSEIHKDPLRERGTIRAQRSFSDKQLEQITEIVKAVSEAVK